MTYRERYEALTKAIDELDNKFESSFRKPNSMTFQEYSEKFNKLRNEMNEFWQEIEKLAEYKAMYEGLCK